MKHVGGTALLSAFQGLRITAVSGATAAVKTATTTTTTTMAPLLCTQTSRQSLIAQFVRLFSGTTARQGSWLEPKLDRTIRMQKGRPRVPTGGSTKGTTVAWGDYGLRMTDHHRRISAAKLKMAEDTIKTRLRGERYRLYKRVACNIGVFYSGNEMRMGKGKGSFDHWATRVAINQVVFEIRGMIHEAIIRDAFRLAGNKLPGQWEVVKKGDPPVVGITKLQGITLEELKRPRRKLPEAKVVTPPVSPSISTTPSTVPPPS